MSLVSAVFLVFVAAVLLLYYIVPKSFRFWVVLAASLAFAAFLGFYTLLFVTVSAVLCYIGGLLAGPSKSGKKGNAARTAATVITVVINIALLCAVKYYNVLGFAAERLNLLFGASEQANTFFLYAVPVGMSFYVLQTTGYILDCRWETISPEDKSAGSERLDKDLSKALNVAKEIENAKQLIEQYHDKANRSNYEKLDDGKGKKGK